MCDGQYDASSKLLKLFEEKQKQRKTAKEYYRNFLYNPYRPAQEGMPFDSALFRFSAMSAYHSENFRVKAKHIPAAMVYIFGPFAFYYFLKSYRDKEEKLLRSGQVKYSDRKFRFIM